MFSLCLSMIGGALSRVMLCNFLALIRIILNLLGYWPNVSTPESVFLTLSADDSMSLTKE